MLSKKDFGLFRFFMLLGLIGYVLLTVITEVIFKANEIHRDRAYITIAFSIVFLLMVIFIHPNYHRIIGIPLLVLSGIQIYYGFRSFQSQIRLMNHFPSSLFTFFNFLITIISSIVLLYIFLKKRNYHFSDFVMVGIAFVLSTPNMMSNMFRLLFINRGYVEELRFAYVISFLGNIQWTLYLLIIAIYIYEARRLEKGTSITESLNPIKSNQLYALQKRYKDGKITYYEYQEAKSNLLASEDDLS